MKIVIAPDSFKESLSAKAVCCAIERGFSDVFMQAQYVHLPLADGGEGTVDVLMQTLNGQWQSTVVEGPLGQQLEASWALLDCGKTALIEVAAASGLDLLPTEKRNPLLTSTYGTGQLIQAALDCGVSKIILGLGGSATNDGGAGIIQALGGQFYGTNEQELPKGGGALSSLVHLELNQVDPRVKEIEMVLACDVTNPLCGESGASKVFGPQKGASELDVIQLDKALDHFSSFASKAIQIDPLQTPGYGAAGGIALGLSMLFNISIKPGIEMVLDILDANHVIKNADLIITGEGQMDNQTLQGKTPWGIAQRAKKYSIPVIAIAGSLGADVDKLYSGVTSLFGTVRSPQDLPQVLEEAEANLTRTARNVAATLKLGQSFAFSQ